MREIIFRGKRVDNREWVEGDLVHDAFNGASRNIAIGIQEKGCYPVEVIPETVGQFTTLLDKNKKRIFEGDLLKYLVVYPQAFQEKCPWKKHGRTCGPVEWIDGWMYADRKFKGEEMLLVKEYAHDFEIIGNIHTTPELLK